MSKRAERITTSKVLENYQNSFLVQFHPNIPGPLSPSCLQADPGQRAKTVDKPTSNVLLDLSERPDEIRSLRERDDRVKKHSPKQSVVHKPRTIRSMNAKTRWFSNAD